MYSTKCLPGEAGTPCKKCIPGKYRGENDLPSSCLLCDLGQTSSDGSAICSTCEIGKYASSKGTCSSCEIGLYTDTRGQEKCSTINDCPNGKIPNNKQTGCELPPWGACKKDEYLYDFPTNDQSVWNCQTCPQGAVCTNNPYLSSLRHTKGYWTIPNNGPQPLSEPFAICPYPNNCNATNCTAGNIGTVCAICENNHFRLSSGSCSPCTASSNAARSGAIITLLLFITMAYLLYRYCQHRIKKLRETVNVKSNRYADALELAFLYGSDGVKIFIVFMQISSTAPGVLDLPFPAIYKDFLQAFSWVNFDVLGLLGLDCVGNLDYRTRVVLSCMLPVLIVGFSALSFLKHKLCGLKKNTKTSGSNVVSTAFQLLSLIHAPVSAKLFNWFDCHKIGSKSYLREDYSLLCDSDAYSSFSAFVWIFLLGFTFFLPICLLLILITYRKVLQTPKVMQKYGFLYDTYRPGAEYWDIHELIRRLALTGLLVFVPPTIRIAACLLVSILACCTLFGVKPHTSNIIQRLEQSSFLVLAFKYVGTVLLLVKLDDEDANLLGIVFILLDVVYIIHSLTCFASIARYIWRASGNKQNGKEKETLSTSKSIRTSVVVPAPQIDSTATTNHDMHIYAALKLQQNMRAAIHNKLTNKRTDSLTRIKSIRTRTAEEIQRTSTNHRNSTVKQIKKRHTARHSSLQIKVKARQKAKRSNALQKCSIFSELDEVSIATIIDKMECEIIDSGTDICKQGDVADMLYLLMAGSCDVKIDGKKVADLKELDVFGEGALFPSANGVALRGATVNALEDVQLLCLSKEKLDLLVKSKTLNKECLLKLAKVFDKRVKMNEASIGTSVNNIGSVDTVLPASVDNKSMENTNVASVDPNILATPSVAKVAKNESVENIRKLMSKTIKSKEKLRKMFTKCNQGDGSITTMDRMKFETMTCKFIELYKRKKKKDLVFLKDETWTFAIGGSGSGKETKIEYSRLVVWLGLANKN